MKITINFQMKIIHHCWRRHFVALVMYYKCFHFLWKIRISCTLKLWFHGNENKNSEELSFFSVVYKGNLYIFGGYNGLHDLHFRDIFRFDPGKLESAWMWLVNQLFVKKKSQSTTCNWNRQTLLFLTIFIFW